MAIDRKKDDYLIIYDNGLQNTIVIIHDYTWSWFKKPNQTRQFQDLNLDVEILQVGERDVFFWPKYTAVTFFVVGQTYRPNNIAMEAMLHIWFDDKAVLSIQTIDRFTTAKTRGFYTTMPGLQCHELRSPGWCRHWLGRRWFQGDGVGCISSSIWVGRVWKCHPPKKNGSLD